jgi:hypothetical protein
MTHRSKNLQPNLFEAGPPRVELWPKQKAELAATVEALLREIAAALAKAARGESGDDQDHD